MEELKRILVSETPEHIGETVKLCGWVSIRRDHGKLIFIELRDRSGKVQVVILPDHPEAALAAKEVRSEYAIEVTGLVKARPGKAENAEQATGSVEIEATSLQIISQPIEEPPIDVSNPELSLNLDTLLNHRTLTLRNDKVHSIFSLYALLLEAYAAACRKRGFLEVKTPKIVSAATEGGANFFKIQYFDREAFLAQSPQFYKQAGVSAFERVFEIGTVFRAEPHFTTRHVNEYTGLDAEMGFIGNFEDVMAELEGIMMEIVAVIGERGQTDLARYGAATPPVVAIPRIRLADAVEILKREYGKETEGEDIDSEGERMISEYVAKTYGSDFIFLTHYPTAIRPFYSMPNADDPKYTDTFDLLFRGIEIASGGQRIHEYQVLVDTIKKRGMDPEAFKDYLDIFKYGTPPHGGWGLGSERIIQKLLGLGSIKEAVLFPRDVKRLTP
ncbi:MAG: aspartate--tRNA(Asn) ligase [Candidatus Moranbacteria bacterium RIFCSPHIGHO2_01_FULL_54_31]|nr:MAG: aspartate--tRNA(Asn) ligase [Candidatus Moranbacteria bacterium RIFCSPHIGHO2_01_FULL_54_31]